MHLYAWSLLALKQGESNIYIHISVRLNTFHKTHNGNAKDEKKFQLEEQTLWQDNLLDSSCTAC